MLKDVLDSADEQYCLDQSNIAIQLGQKGGEQAFLSWNKVVAAKTLAQQHSRVENSEDKIISTTFST